MILLIHQALNKHKTVAQLLTTMNVTEIFYTVFSVIFLEQNTRQIPHRFNHYQYTVGSADSDNLIHHQGRQKSEDYSK